MAPADRELVRLKALRLTIEQLESACPDDPFSPFVGEAVIARADVLAAIDRFAGVAVASIPRDTPEPQP